MTAPIPQPRLETERLLLRSFTLADAPAVQELASAIEIAANTLRVPHPYEEGMAEAWIHSLDRVREEGTEIIFALAERETDLLVGAMGLTIEPVHVRAELGYWIGKPFWGCGYATEAGRALLGFGFDRLGLNCIHAAHFTRNPASGRVLQKLGMRSEGLLRQRILKWGVFEDIAPYSILAAEWRAGA